MRNHVAKDQWAAVDRYISDLFVGQDATLDAALADSAAAGLPDIQVSAPAGKLLHLLARAVGARSVLEVGTLGGYSTIWLARAIAPGGRLITLEVNPTHAAVARANVARAGVSDIVDVRLGRALDSLPQLVAEGAGPFDLVFIDADKPNIAEYFTWALRLTRPGGVIIVDNVVRNGAVIDAASDDVNVQGVRRFNELAAANRRVSTTVIQTVGSKGYDGFSLSVVLDGA
ncbi:MAG TPA: O-methyltransferase [Gemmatimonadaceae bacterium]|nr:O-methyltransferase [Gemmatimonadaceae bacterium]